MPDTNTPTRPWFDKAPLAETLREARQLAAIEHDAAERQSPRYARFVKKLERKISRALKRAPAFKEVVYLTFSLSSMFGGTLSWDILKKHKDFVELHNAIQRKGYDISWTKLEPNFWDSRHRLSAWIGW
jgi:hypothetical protein